MSKTVMSFPNSASSNTPMASTELPASTDSVDVPVAVVSADQDKSTPMEISGRASPSASLGLIKCPMYCRSNCVVKHHPLLVAILNCADTTHIELMEMKLAILSNVINKYKQNLSWSVNLPIPDMLDDYKYPMLHWACTLGRVGAAIWLLGHNISDPTTKSDRHNGETALHRALLCLQETCPVEPSRKFVQLLSVLESALSIPDNNGNTPLHVCCEMLRIGLPRVDYYKECLHYMMYEIGNDEKNTREQASAILNMKNSEGDTLLHLLAENDKHLSDIKPLVMIGAEFTVENNAGLTPYQVALSHDCVAICRFLETWLGTPLRITSSVHQGSIEPDTDLVLESAKQLTVPSQAHSELISPTAAISSLDSDMALQDSSATPSDSGQVATDDGVDENSGEPPEKREKLNCKGPDLTPEKILSEESASDQWSVDNVSLEKTLRESAAVGKMQLKPFPILFPDDEDTVAQSYFEDVMDDCIKNKSKIKSRKRLALSFNEFSALTEKLDLHDSESWYEVKEAVKQMYPSLLTGYLVAMKTAGSSYQPVIDFLLKMRNQDLNKLKLAGKCATSLQQIFKEEQAKQEEHISHIMGIFEHLHKLSKEERKLSKDLSEIVEHSNEAKITNTNVRERLANCESALKVLKGMYIDATANADK